MEEIKSCLPSKVRAHLDERELHTLADAGPAAHNFSLTNIDSFHRNQPWFPSSPSQSIRSFSIGNSATIGECAGGGRGTTDNPWERRTVTCSYCKTPGHHINFCKRQPSRSYSSVQERTVLQASILPNSEVRLDSQAGDVPPSFNFLLGRPSSC